MPRGVGEANESDRALCALGRAFCHEKRRAGRDAKDFGLTG